MVGFNCTSVLPQNYQPTWNSNVVGWWRADQGTTISTGVSQWNDLSSTGNNVIQATGSQQPTIVISGINGLPSLAFNYSASQFLADASFTTYNQPVAVYVVAVNNTSFAGAIIGGGSSGTTGIVRDNGSGPSVVMDTGPYTQQVSSAQNADIPFVGCAIFNGASSKIYTNGATVNGTVGTAAFGGGLAIGSDGNTAYWNKWISEIIIVKGASTVDQNIVNYLNAKYTYFPLTIAGCTMWLNASSGITLNGSTVSAWTDQSGSGNSIAQATPGNQPTYVASTVNGLPALTFGSSAIMTRAGADTLASNFTMVAVVKSTNNSIGYQVIYGNNGGVTYVCNSASPWGIYLGVAVSSKVTITDNNYHVLICGVTSPSGAVTFMTDGVISTGTGTSAYTVNSGDLGSNTQATNGNIAEIIEYNTVLTTTQMYSLTQYLGSKYAIPVVGPVNPATIPGCQLWLRSDNGVLVSGSTATAWNDLSGNGNNYTVGALNAPGYATNFYNNKPTLQGVDATRGLENFTLTAASTYTLVLAYAQNNTDTGGIVIYDPATGHINITEDKSILSGSVGWTPYNGGPYDNNSFHITDNNLHQYIVTQTDGGTLTGYVDGVQQFSKSAVVNVSGATMQALFGANTGSGGCKGNMVELMQYNTVLSAPQIASLYSYHQATWSAPIPLTIPGCQLWLRADQGITIATGVSQWNDMSGNGNNTTQGTVGKQPTYNTTDAGYNGMPTLSFLAANATVLSGTIPSTPQPFTLILVGEWAANSTILQATSSVVNGIYSNASGYLSMYAGSVLSSGTTSITGKCVIAAVFNGATLSAGYVNNSQTAIFTGDPGSGGLTATGGGIFIGSGNLSANTTGKVAEAMIYNSALSASQLQTIFAYLGTRYSIATS